MDGTAADRDELEKQLQNQSASPISLPYEFLKDITNSFSTELELGRGGFGVVYKGVLRSGQIIAVKKLFDSYLVKDDGFEKEVTNVMGMKHENIVRLIGYCAETRGEAMKLPNGNNVMAEIRKRLLCFEYLPNKSLDKYISEESSGLDWNERYEIIKGICSGLQFLNRECHIVHLDLKPENILMDATMRPKIADFGLSKILGAQKSQTIIHGSIAGSLGYMAPEYLRGVVSPQADIFSFGVVIIEIITGRKHDYPSSTALSLQHLHVNANNGGTSTEISVQQYIDNVLAKWRNVFQEEQKYTSPQTYTEQICCCQKRRLLRVWPSKLCFNFKTPHVLGFSSLDLTNNINDSVAFRIKTNDRNKYFPRPVHGHVLPRSVCTLRVAMLRPPEDDKAFTIMLECIIAGDQYQLTDIESSCSAGNSDRFFEEAKNKGHEVQQKKLLFTIAHEIRYVMITGHPQKVHKMYVHPTETWIVSIPGEREDLFIWDYQWEEEVPLPEFGLPADGAAVFIPRKQWFVVADWEGYITVCNDDTMQEVKTFSAHRGRISSLDVHPSEPYVLSASYHRYGDGTVKMWNWEKDWECIRTFDVGAREVKFNPKDPDYFACATNNGVKILSIASTYSYDLNFSSRGNYVPCLDYLSCGDEIYLIIADEDSAYVTIWDWKNWSHLKTLEGHTDYVNTTCAHPELPLLITGSEDGTVCLWNSSTFELEGKLNCDLGAVRDIACLKGSNRIAIGHEKGLAIAEI